MTVTNRRRLLQLGATLGLAGIVGGCRMQSADNNLPFEMTGPEVERLPVAPDDAAAAAAQLTSFAGQLLVQQADSKINVALSPLSIWAALAMTRNGAAGATATQMDTALQFPALPVLNSGLNSISQHLQGLNGKFKDGAREGQVVVRLINQLIGDRIATQAQGNYWEPPFLESLARNYGSKLALADFSQNAAESRKIINDWVASQTQSRIVDLMPDGLIRSNTRLVLLNCLYFAASWRHVFNAPTSGKFSRPEGPSVPVEMLATPGPQPFLAKSGPDYTVVSIPYLKGGCAMSVILPAVDKEETTSAQISKDLGQVLSGRKQRPVQLTLPQFRVRHELSLKASLAQLGMEDAFQLAADFSQMSSEPIQIQDVVHQAFIVIDREGTEAAAATAVVGVATSAPLDPLEVVINRPFWFVIHDVDYTTPMFIGRIADPTITQ